MATHRLPIVILITSLLSVCVRAAPCPEPAKQGSSYTFTQDVDVDSDDDEYLWIWIRPNGLGDIALTKCTASSGLIFNRLPDQYDSTLEKVGGQYRSTLTIKTVGRDMDGRQWVLRKGPNTLKNCTLQVYSFDSSLACNDIQVTNGGSSSSSNPFVISWTCSVSNVYPSPLCQFEYKTGNQNYQTVSTNHVSKDDPTSEGDPAVYSRTCALILPVSTSLQPGTTMFKVTVYPDVTGTSPSLGTSKTDDVTLSLPKASLKDCPSGSDLVDGYVKKGTTATCLCHLTDVGVPAGQPQWLNKYNQQLGQWDGSGSLSLTVSYIKDDTDPPFTCRGSSQLGVQTDDIETYTPKFASDSAISLTEEDCNIGTAIGVTVACCLLLSLGTFILGMEVEKRRICRKKSPPKMLKPSPPYIDVDVPPLAEAYVELDSIQLEQAKQQRGQPQSDGYEVPLPRRLPQPQQAGGDYEIQSPPGGNSNNHGPDYSVYDDDFQDNDITPPNLSGEYVDID